MSCKERQSQKGVFLRKLQLQLPVVSPPDTVMNTLTGTRGALPPARIRKGTTKFVGLYGFNVLARQTLGSVRL